MRVQRLASIAAAAAIVLAVSACGDGDDKAADAPTITTQAVPCRGEAAVVGTVTSMSGPGPLKDLMGGVKAAVQAVNHGCLAGRPVKWVSCDDEGDPTQGADCGRKVVKSKAIALVGSGGVASINFEPIVQDAGIPSVGNFAADPNELLRDTSFPFYNGLTRAASRAALTAAAGAKSVSVVIPDNPTFQAILPTFRKILGEFNVAVKRFVVVPNDATDLAQYASQAADAESIMILVDPQLKGLLHELLNAGITPQNKVITAPAMRQAEVGEFGDQLDGLLMTSPTVPLTDTSNKGVAQYLAETKAAGVDDLGDDGMVAWRSMHVLADVIKGLPSLTASNVTKAMRSYAFAPPEAAPVDFTKPAFPEIELFRAYRIFSRRFAVWKVEGGNVKLGVPGFVDPSKPFELK